MTLNIIGIENSTRLRMLDNFVHRHDVDIALLQEVTNGGRLLVKVYQSIINVGTLVRGTAIPHNLHLQLHKPKRIPTGRGLLHIWEISV